MSLDSLAADREEREDHAGAPALLEDSCEGLDEVACEKKKQYGRFRRLVVRPMLWGLAGLAILIFCFQLFIDTPRARNWAKARAALELSKMLDREILIEDIRFELIPLSVEVWGFAISGPQPGDAPFLEVPWAAIDADLGALQSKVIRLRQIRAERPKLHLQYLTEHHNLITFPRSKRQRRFDVLIERIEVDKAEFFLDQESVELSLSADSVRARLQGREHLTVEGMIAAQNVGVRLPNATPQTISVRIEGSSQPGKITIEEAEISSPLFDARADGECGWERENPKDKKCLILVAGRGSGKTLEELGYFSDLSGELSFDGSFIWRPGTFGWRSKVEAERLVIWDRQIEKVRGTLAADRFGVNSFLESADYAGGSLEGSIGYEHREEGRPVDVKLEFTDLDLDTVLADQSIPADGFASRLNGYLDYRFDLLESQKGQGGGEFQVLPGRPGALRDVGSERLARHLPMGGAFPLRIVDGVVRSEAIRLQSERQSTLASGWFDLAATRGEFEYEVATVDIAELGDLLPFLDPTSESVALWLPRTGEGTLSGTLFLNPGEAATDLRLRLEKVETATLTASRVAGGMYVDSNQVDSLHLELGSEEQALLIRGRIPLLDENADDEIEMSFDALDWPLDEIRPWVPFELPFDGPVSGRLELFIGPESSRGRLSARAEPVTLALPTSLALSLDPRLVLDSLSTQLDWDAEDLRFNQLALEGAAGRVTAQGKLGFKSETYDLNLRSSWLRLEEEPFASYLPRHDLSGAMVLTAHLGGQMGRPDFSLAVQAPELRLGSDRLGQGTSRLDLRWQDGLLTARGQLLELIDLDGGGQLDGQRADVRLAVKGEDLHGLLEFLIENPPEDLQGRFDGELRLRDDAPLANGTSPSASTATLDLALATLEIEFRDRVMRNLEPILVNLGSKHLTIESLLIGESASASNLSLAGTLGYETDAELDLRLQAALETTWLQLFLPELETSGTFEMLARIGGTLGTPIVDGQGEILSSRLMVPTVFPHSLDEVSGVLKFHPRAIVIDRLEAQMAGGTLKASGQFVPPWISETPDYRLQLDGQDLRLRYPEGWTLVGDTELVLQSFEDRQLLSGTARLSEIQYFEDVPLGLTQLLQDFFQRQRLEVEAADEVLSQTELNVQLEAPGALRVRNNLVDMSGSVDLLLRGNLVDPVLYGEVDIDSGGLLVYNNNDYEIERGRLIFSSPYELAPEVDILANTRVREVDIAMDLSGTLERLDARFSSEPPLPDLEVFRLLSTGGTIDSDIDAVRRFNRIDEDQSTSAASFLYGQAASVIGQRVNTLFGFDKFRIDPLTGSGDNLSDARLTVGKRLSRDVFVSYSIDPTSTEDPRLRIEWQLSHDLTLVLTQNGDNSYSADARWETSF